MEPSDRSSKYILLDRSFICRDHLTIFGARLNYHHLHYFWAVAREGGVTRASRKLRVAQPTISAQVIALEEIRKRR